MIETCPCGGEPHVRTDCPHYGLPTDAAGDVEIWKAMDMEITQEDRVSVDMALKHLGFDSVADLHYWAKDNNELNRFDALVALLDERAIASEQAVLAKLREHIEHRPMNPILDIAFERWGMIMTGEQLCILTKLVIADALEGKQS